MRARDRDCAAGNGKGRQVAALGGDRESLSERGQEFSTLWPDGLGSLALYHEGTKDTKEHLRAFVVNEHRHTNRTGAPPETARAPPAPAQPATKRPTPSSKPTYPRRAARAADSARSTPSAGTSR
jgi:hypothetical protein